MPNHRRSRCVRRAGFARESREPRYATAPSDRPRRTGWGCDTAPRHRCPSRRRSSDPRTARAKRGYRLHRRLPGSAALLRDPPVGTSTAWKSNFRANSRPSRRRRTPPVEPWAHNYQCDSCQLLGRHEWRRDVRRVRVPGRSQRRDRKCSPCTGSLGLGTLMPAQSPYSPARACIRLACRDSHRRRTPHGPHILRGRTLRRSGTNRPRRAPHLRLHARHTDPLVDRKRQNDKDRRRRKRDRMVRLRWAHRRSRRSPAARHYNQVPGRDTKGIDASATWAKRCASPLPDSMSGGRPDRASGGNCDPWDAIRGQRLDDGGVDLRLADRAVALPAGVEPFAHEDAARRDPPGELVAGRRGIPTAPGSSAAAPMGTNEEMLSLGPRLGTLRRFSVRANRTPPIADVGGSGRDRWTAQPAR